jgi:hypothetical protein
MIVYSLMPIDFWAGWQKPEVVFCGFVDDERHQMSDWGPLWEKAKRLAKRVGWEGDIRGSGPLVTVLPLAPGNYDLPAVIIAWKQDNNGTTFLAAPWRLPWLEADMSSGEWVEEA